MTTSSTATTMIMNSSSGSSNNNNNNSFSCPATSSTGEKSSFSSPLGCPQQQQQQCVNKFQHLVQNPLSSNSSSLMCGWNGGGTASPPVTPTKTGSLNHQQAGSFSPSACSGAMGQQQLQQPHQMNHRLVAGNNQHNNLWNSCNSSSSCPGGGLGAPANPTSPTSTAPNNRPGGNLGSHQHFEQQQQQYHRNQHPQTQVSPHTQQNNFQNGSAGQKNAHQPHYHNNNGNVISSTVGGVGTVNNLATNNSTMTTGLGIKLPGEDATETMTATVTVVNRQQLPGSESSETSSSESTTTDEDGWESGELDASEERVEEESRDGRGYNWGG